LKGGVMRKLKFVAGEYNGCSIGPYGYRRGVQIVAFDADTGKRVYYFHNGKSPCFKMWEGYYHNRTGFSKKDEETFEFWMKVTKEKADGMNKGLYT